MHTRRHRIPVVALLSIVAFCAAVPATGTAAVASTMSSAVQPVGSRLAGAQSGAAPLTGQAGREAVLLAASAVVTPSATITSTAIVSPTATTTPTATLPPPTVTPTSSPTRAPTPRPTHTPTPVPAPTDTPTPVPVHHPLSVRLLAVGVYSLRHGREKRITTGQLGMTVRLKLVVLVAHAPRVGIRVSAAWALRGITGKQTFYRDSRVFLLHNGATGLFYDLVLPAHNFVTGAYQFVGSITYHGAVQRRLTILRVIAAHVAVVPMRVHYAHLRITVPQGWHLDFERDSSGKPVTGPDSLLMLSASGLALLDAVTVHLNTTPSTGDLHNFPAQLLSQEFPGGVTNVTTIFFKGQIDGHDVFAAQGDVTIRSRKSQAIAIVTNKKQQFYSFTVVNYFKRAPASELHAALTAVFGSKLD